MQNIRYENLIIGESLSPIWRKTMVYEQDGYVLHTRNVELKGGRTQTIYFFCKKGNKPKSGEPCDMPDNKVVGVNERTGLPYLKNK